MRESDKPEKKTIEDGFYHPFIIYDLWW
jgi:hypothetical protein